MKMEAQMQIQKMLKHKKAAMLFTVVDMEAM